MGPDAGSVTSSLQKAHLLFIHPIFLLYNNLIVYI